MKNTITVLTKGLLDFLFFAGILITLTIPLTLKLYGKRNIFFEQHYVYLTVVFVISGILAILIIKELRSLFRSVLNDDCFIKENVVSLRKMGTLSFFIAFATSFRCYLYLSPAVIITIIVFLITGLLSKVLSQVFDKAVTYKLENDLTI